VNLAGKGASTPLNGTHFGDHFRTNRSDLGHLIQPNEFTSWSTKHEVAQRVRIVPQVFGEPYGDWESRLPSIISDTGCPLTRVSITS
jgi:hypothetical protein